MQKIQKLLSTKQELIKEKHRLKCEMDSSTDELKYLVCQVRIQDIRLNCDAITKQVKQMVDNLVDNNHQN